MTFRAYSHVLRMNRPEVDGILNGTVSIFSKLDGSSGEMVFNPNTNEINYGSRKREISIENDNAGFADYMTNSNDSEIVALRQWVTDHPNYILYGEYLAGEGTGRKFTGTIKSYIEGGFFVFDVYDINRGNYLDYEEYYDEIHSIYHKVIPRIAKLENPTMAEVESYVDSCTFNLPHGMIGEGIVIKNTGYRDEYGHIQIAKIVRAEYLQRKIDNHSKVRKNTLVPEELEKQFIEETCTPAYFAKEQNKVLEYFQEDSWDSTSKKLIGFMMNTVVDDIMTDDFWPFFRKRQTTVDLRRIRSMIQTECRKFLGLM